MSTVPKIGLSKIGRKVDVGAVKVAEELTALSNNLAGAARRARRLAEETAAHERGLAALEDLDATERNERQAEHEAKVAAARAVLDPRIEEARELLARNAEARRAARPIVQRLRAIDTGALLKRLPDRSVSAHTSLHNQIGLMFAAAEDLAPSLDGKDLDLSKAIDAAEFCSNVANPSGKAVLGTLKYWIDATRGTSDFISGKVGAIERILALVDTELAGASVRPEEEAR
jgi:hypothetical protein